MTLQIIKCTDQISNVFVDGYFAGKIDGEKFIVQGQIVREKKNQQDLIADLRASPPTPIQYEMSQDEKDDLALAVEV